jgi:pimeloyl-ACP methyl ester carboxylesterase
VWVQQIGDFIRQVVRAEEPLVLVGNSLGGYASLSAAASYPDMIKGLCLLNSAGQLPALCRLRPVACRLRPAGRCWALLGAAGRRCMPHGTCSRPQPNARPPPLRPPQAPLRTRPSRPTRRLPSTSRWWTPSCA